MSHKKTFTLTIDFVKVPKNPEMAHVLEVTPEWIADSEKELVIEDICYFNLILLKEIIKDNIKFSNSI